MHLLSPTLAVLWLGGLVVGSIQTSGNTHRQHSSSNHHQRAAATVNILHESHESNHGRPYSPPPYTYIAGCKELLRRKEWRFMTNSEKMDFIGAVKCLQSLPAKNPIIPQARTRFDEFQAQHIYVANNVHVVGQFLPWHRWFLTLFEKALKEECSYSGGHPYWDWTLDTDSASSLKNSPVFDPVYGFGGDGVPGTYTAPADPDGSSRMIPGAFRGCVMDGPFANYTLRLGPGKYITNHCLTRGINDTSRQFITPTALAKAMNLPTFEEFRIEVEGEPITDGHRMHDGGHMAVSGEMSNFFSSPGDPLFYLHHAMLDKIWWNWQQSWPQRMYEMTGRSTVYPPFSNVTLESPLYMPNLGPTVKIGDIMDIRSAPSCYTYV